MHKLSSKILFPLLLSFSVSACGETSNISADDPWVKGYVKSLIWQVEENSGYHISEENQSKVTNCFVASLSNDEDSDLIQLQFEFLEAFHNVGVTERDGMSKWEEATGEVYRGKDFRSTKRLWKDYLFDVFTKECFEPYSDE